jgi:hypothetical protein
MKAPLQPGDRVMIRRRTKHPEFWDSGRVMWKLMREGRTHVVSNVKELNDSTALVGHSWTWRRKDLVLLLKGDMLVERLEPNMAFKLKKGRR